MVIQLETVVVFCPNCNNSERVVGKNGTSTHYKKYCSYCGSRGVQTKDEIVDPSADSTDWYANEYDIDDF